MSGMKHCLAHVDIALGNTIGGDGAERIARALEKRTTATKVGLRSVCRALSDVLFVGYRNRAGSNIGHTGAGFIGRALENNASITAVDLSGERRFAAGLMGWLHLRTGKWDL